MRYLTGPPRRHAPALALLIAGVVLSLAGVASATTVVYTTSGVFTSSAGSSISSGGVTVSFVAGGGTISAPSSISLGSFNITGLGSGSLSDTFTLTVNQSIPVPGGSMAFGQATVSGTISVSSSQAVVQFTSPLSVTIAGTPSVTYTIKSADDGVAGKLILVPPNAGGNTTIQGAIAVPLPATANMGLTLIGCLSGFGAWRRWKGGQDMA